MALFSLQNNLFSLPMLNSTVSTKSLPSVTTRRATIFGSTLLLLNLSNLNSTPLALPQLLLDDELQQQEDHVVQLFQDTSLSVVFIKDIELAKVSKSFSKGVVLDEDEDAKVEGSGSGFIWDKFGHIVTNYHVVSKLATDTSGLQRCKVFLVDAKGNSFYREGKIIGFDPAYDLAVLKVDVDGYQVKPANLGQSNNLRVGQSCFAIGNPYGYENTLTTGVVSGLGREIPSPNGGAIRGAIQTDAAINAGNLTLIDVHSVGTSTSSNYQSSCKTETKFCKRTWTSTMPVISIFISTDGYIILGKYKAQVRSTWQIHFVLPKRGKKIYSSENNLGNSGGPLIDSYGHVIGVNTATFTKKGTGMSSGVNFAIPIDTVVRTVPYLIVYGTPYSNRF
ncbi:hypothetical protein V8G54_032325 [Vigna mungo]|uniref:Protease Do-like 5, chloroplastic n=1 Tax=Vigna mungo TaxID=3915 RepID=A0AAQ3RHR4_VIGMU